MNDLISRQAAIDALCDEYCDGWQDCKYYPKCENLKAIQNLPSAQPEIVRCEDCKLFGDEKCLMYFDGYDWAEPDGYCHLAERREEGEADAVD